jgi:hypothetical protein
MRKKNLFTLASFFCAVGWLEVFNIKPGFAYACWILAIISTLSFIYGICKKDDDDQYKPYNFNN